MVMVAASVARGAARRITKSPSIVSFLMMIHSPLNIYQNADHQHNKPNERQADNQIDDESIFFGDVFFFQELDVVVEIEEKEHGNRRAEAQKNDRDYPGHYQGTHHTPPNSLFLMPS
jgi:hypothetical protein